MHLVSLKSLGFFSIIWLNVLSVSVFLQGMRSDCWILPRDGALWALTWGTEPLLVRPSECVCICVCMWVIWGKKGSLWDKELSGFLHLFSHSIGVCPPLPGLQSPGLRRWCQHDFASNLQGKNNNNKECVYPAMFFCMQPLICWNCVKFTSFENVCLTKINQ